MKQVMRFSVDGQTVDVPRDELEEFQAAAADHGAKPDEVQGIRVTGADGRAQDVEVPTSEMGDFEAAALEHGATFEPMRTVKMNDGSVRKMSVGELSQFLRSDAYLKSDDHKETVSQLAQRGLDEGSVGWSRVGGFFRGLGYGAWQGAEAAADKIAKAIPETALDIDAAAGHVLKGVSKLGDNAVTRSIGRLGEATVQSATAAKAWLNEKIGSSTGDRLGYEDWSTAFSDFIGDVAGMAYKFAPGMSTGAPMGAKAVATMDAKARAALGAKVVAESGGRILPKAGALAKIAPTDLMGNAVAVSKLQKIGAYARAALGGNFGAYMETVFGSDGINAYAAMYDAAIENGMTPRQAAKIGGEAFLLNYFGGRVMMRAGGMADGIKSPMWRFLAGGEAISDVMALQAAGNKGLENEATGRPVTEGMGGALWDGKMEGLLFHGLNAVPGAILQKVENREAWLRHERWRRGFILDMLKEGDGAAELYTMMSSDKLDAAIRARREVLARQEPTAGAVGTEQGKPSVGTEQGKTAAEQGKAATGAASGATAAGAEQGKASAGTEQGKAATGAKKKVDFVRLAIAAGVPEVMSRAEMNNLVDALARQRDALNERVRLQMSDERAEALSATIDGPVKALLDEKRLDPKDVNDVCARIWLKASEKITDASSLDDPDFRQKLVETATREVVGEMSREKQVQADERSRLRGAPVSAQVGEIEERHITSWEDAEADGLIGKDEKGRWTGGMRQALNIAINGTDRLKTEVRDGKMDGEVAEDLISAAYCELGGRPSDERALLVDRVLDFADGNAESARRLMDKIAAQERSSDVPLLDELKRLEDEVTREMEAGIGAWADGPEAARPPQTAYEGAANAERLKGTELKSRDGGVMGCQRFPEVRVEISQEGIRVDGLTDDLISRPENAADAAALLKRLNDIAERNGLTIDLRDANAKAAADALLDEINRGGLEAAQAKLDTRAKLFGLLFKTTLGNGVTYDEASFRAALEKTSNGRPFIDRHGNIYGMTDGEGVVHFNPAALNFNTPIHEYGHLALEAIRGINPALWQRGKELVRNSDYFKEIKGSSETEGNEYAYLKGRDDAICDEALATLIGDRGERLVEGTRLGAELKAWLKEVWKAFKGALGLADLTEEQIERMTLGEFVDAVNAELLKGSEFGTRKRAPLSKTSIRKYDETDGSGSNGLLRWKNDRGYLFALPVDMERTQPGGRVVLARDDANVTDWIERRLAGLELRLSESGKVYVKGRNGFEGELADVFGRYPTIGQNDGLAAQIAQETGRAEWAGATAEELVAGLAKDRASYGAWAEARAAGTGADALAAREEAAARAEAEGAAERRWQDSGMGVVEYIRDMAERGEPGFDLDWETAREIERERTQGLLKNLEEVGLMHAGAAARAAATGQGATAAEDAAYLDAVRRGDMETARRLLKVAWERNGYSADMSYRDAHAAPSAPVDAKDFRNAEALNEARNEGWDLNLWAIAKGITGQPGDFFSERGPSLYMYDDAAGRETQAAIASAIQSIRGGNDNARIIVYRAVPKGVKFDGLQSGGQWVSPSKTYAENHGKSRFGFGKYRIVREVVKAENLWWDGNDAREWGYDDGRQYVYRNSENGMKLATVTYDDAGEVIPLSRRFDAAKPDLRFSVARKEDASWRAAVDDFVGRKMRPRSDATVLPRVPAVIARVLREKLGVDSAGRRIVVSSDCMKKAMQGKHRIPAEQMKKLAVSLDAPLAVFQSKTRPKDTVTALVPIRDLNGGISSVVPLDYTARASDGANALRITSVYGKLSSEAVQSWIDQGYLLYADRKNISRSFPHRLQLPGRNKTANRFLDETDFSQEALGIVSNRGEERNGGTGLAPRAQDGGEGAAARAAATGQGAGPRAQDGTTRVQGEGRGATGQGEGRFSVGPGGPGRALVNKALFVAGRARVADDAGVGEQTPGSLALSRELSTQGVTPLSQLGTLRKISLPVSAMEFVRKRLTGDAAPAAVVKRLPGGRAAAHTAAGRLYISADIYGTVDKSDMAKEKARLKAHGFFRNEDPGWCATQYPAAIRAEQRRSDDALANQLDNLGSRRARGLTDGGQAAATQVFADELARIVLEMPQQTAGVLGSVQTIGKSVRTEAFRRFAPSAGAHGTGQNGANAGQGAQGQTAEAAARAEAGGFLDWAYGGPLTDPATGNSVSRGDVSTMGELANAMFGKWLVMPREMETRAPTWSQVIEATVANDPRLKDAFEEVSRHFTTEQASGYLVERIRKQQSKDTEAALKKLQWEARNPIGAGSWIANAQEGLFVGFHDKFAPVTVRISQKLKDYKAAQKALLRRTPNAADRAAIRAETDRFIGEVGRLLHRLELSRTACERGAFNEGNRYFLEMLRLEGKAYERWGLTEEDRSLYLRLQRVIETQGRAASDGMSARQAQIALDEMKTRLGAAKYAKLEQYGREFFGIHERELLNDRRLEAAFGKAFVDYLRTQEHYTATIRTLSVDEIAAVNAARAAARAAGVAGGDDMVSAAYAYGGARGAGDVCGEAAWTMPLKGSMAAAQEARSATWMKVDRLMHFLRRNQMMIDLRDALLKAGVEGVRDLRRTDGAEWPDNERYGHLNYMVDGEKRTLVVPRQIADAFRVDPDAAQWITKANGLVRALYIDYNPAYWAQNVKRNQDSIEKNMPGMRETYAKTALRAVAPGMGAASDLVLQALVRNVPQAGCLFNRHTVYAHIPKAERYARILEKTVEWQRELWAAEDAGDVAKVLQMNEDFAGVMEMLKGNFLVPMAQAYRGPETNGFAFEAFSRKGLKSFEQVDAENRARSKGRKLLDAINVFKKNQAQQEHEDVIAKVIAYLHDRMEYGAIRSVEESGLIVKKNVSIAEGERAGRLKRPMQQFVAQFFNMVEKGVVRHWNALRERPGETLIADGKVWMGRLIGGLFASGALMKWMLDDSDGDEEKAKAKYGFVFGYAKAFHRAYQNCSEYVKENYNITPIWNGPDGYTSIVIGGALTDEDKLIVPTADYASGMVAHLMGIAPAPSIGKAIANSTVKAVTPDLQLAGPIVTLLRDTVEATLIDNPTDYFRGAPMYDQRLWENRNESWEMRGQFAAAVGAKLWNDFGGRSLLAMDVNGVDNGRGSAPETLESVLRRLPVVSPAIGRMIKIQVGSPAKRGATIREQEAKTRSLIGLLSEKLLKGRKGDVGWHERDFDGFQKQIEDWTKTYGFTPEDVSKLRMRYYNAWIQFKNREGYDRQELARLFAQGRKQGLSEEQLWIMLGDL